MVSPTAIASRSASACEAQTNSWCERWQTATVAEQFEYEIWVDYGNGKAWDEGVRRSRLAS
ncbi:hypothetical protein E5345_04515 [Propionibacterium sp. NM47_B9-13]|uniref:Uncharacterized protein n=2 Tax=Cutibacterium modestum TaxID=2559073 RepID=A0AAD1NW24_9ACTN|nr:hypothetical protein HMPREF9621_00343 [Cutibacterium modestum HL037PA2]EFS91165.1 hypothetical protein HMPREF9607_02455 [Cutibacterium modestum HL044PA1]EFT16533.1 hypothetical protein HMPREF9622_00363 [Cutibacterium modestum HL037PA3]REB74773.1 hypothetical protein CP877_02675 [Cutibacterium modestum]TGY29292.1 hypothetical protein E5345_04515 [Propionibacterium sp. NM47_B9-13]